MTIPTVPLAAGRRHSLAVVDGGRVLAAGWNAHGQCKVADQTEMVGIAAGWRRTRGCRRPRDRHRPQGRGRL